MDISTTAYTHSISQIRLKGDHRVVNLPQETVREYSDEEYSGDTNNLGNVHYFKTRGTTVQDKNKNMKLVFKALRVETLTEFIQEAVKILNTYEDAVFEDFFHVLDKEIRKYHYRGCKFSELTQNSYTRSLLARSLKLIRGKSVSFTKAIINEVVDIIRDETYDKNVKNLLNYINSLYTNYIEINFHSVLNELKYYRNTKSVGTHNNLVQVIKGGVRAVLFNPYTELNTNIKRELKERIDIFWKQLKNNNDILNTDPVIKSVINNSSTVPENIMKPYSKNYPQIKLNNERETYVSMDTYDEQFLRDESEKDESSNESREQITNYNTGEISSGQSFDSSSNSIKNSQERHEKYNTQRYMTLYTEEISYKSKTTKKTEIIPITASVRTRRPKVKKRPKTTSTPREGDVSSGWTEKLEILRLNHDMDNTELNISNSNHDTGSDLTLESNVKPRARENYGKQRKQGKADESKSKRKQKNVKIISHYDAVIDVQLANTELLKSLGMFDPLGMEMKYDSTLYPKSDRQTKPVLTKSTKRPRAIRAQAEIRPRKRTAPTKPRSRYSKRKKFFYRKQLRDLRKNIMPPVPYEGHQFMEDKNINMKYLRRSDNDTTGAEDFNSYIIKRINAMENKLNELKKKNDFSLRSRMNDNNTNGVEARYITEKFEVKYKNDSKRKDMKGNVIETLFNEDHDLNNEEGNDGRNFSIRNNTINTGSSTNNNKSHKLNDIKKDAVNATVIDNKNTTLVTNNISKINVNVTKKLNIEVINNNVTTSSFVKVTKATKLASVVTTPTVAITRRTMTYTQPSYYDSEERNRPTVHNSKFESFFKHINDGIDLRM